MAVQERNSVRDQASPPPSRLLPSLRARAASDVVDAMVRSPAFIGVALLIGLGLVVTYVLEEDAEDRADLEAARVARAEAEEVGTIPWERLKAELGL